jgi:multiple sugar transport system substrate-binding protein
MDENVIFSKSDQTSPPVTPQAQSPVGAPQPSNIPVSLPTPQPAPVQVTPGVSSIPPTDPTLPKPPSSSRFPGGILKWVGIALGVVVLLLIVLFVVSKLRGSPKDEPVTLAYWGLFEDKQVMQSLIDDFHRLHPTITINYVQKDVRDYRQSLVTQLNNGNGPDLYRFHNSWVGMMKPYLSPMVEGTLSPDDLKNNYYPVIQQDLVRNGALYGIPLQIDDLSLFINTDLFSAGGKSAPKTWDEFVKVAKDLVVKDSDGRIQTAGAALGTFDNITHAPDIIALLMAQNGTNFSDFQSTKANASQALDFYTAFSRDEGSVWDDTLDPSLTAFAKGNLAMYIGYSWDIFGIKALNPQLNFSIHPVPNLPGRKVGMASYWVEGVSSKSKHQKEAMLFMKYLTEKETLQKHYTEIAKTRIFGELYPRRDLAETLMSNPLLAPFFEQAEYATSSYFMSDTYDKGINEQMNVYLGNTVRGQDQASTATNIDTLSEGVDQVLAKYGR